MARYEVFIKPSAVKEIEALPTRKVRRQVLGRIRDLAEDPRPPGCRKLSGGEKYRVRQGRYRLLYTIDDDARGVVVVRVAHRKKAY